MLPHLKKWNKGNSRNAAVGKWRLWRLWVNGELESQEPYKVTYSPQDLGCNSFRVFQHLVHLNFS